MERSHTNYTQNFDILPDSGTAVWANGTSYMAGWSVQRTKQTSSIIANDGSSNTGAFYSYGSNGSKERALGAISSLNAGEFAWSVLLQNTTGDTIHHVDISFYGEQWRISNKTAGEHKIAFYYALSDKKESFDLSPRADAKWVPYPDLDFKSPHFFTEGKRLNGNASANRAFLATQLTVNIPDGHYLMLRWKDADELEADHGLAIDDFSITWSVKPDEPLVVLPVELVRFTARNSGAVVQLQWLTASEFQNDFFSIERSSNGHIFESIGRVAGNGTTAQGAAYGFKDEYPLVGTSYYRLKQVDEDGSHSYSSVVAVTRTAATKLAKVYPTLTSNKLEISVEQIGTKQQVLVMDMMGRQVLQKKLDKTSLQHTLDVSNLSDGSYVLVLLDEQGQRQTTRFMKR
ncbi:T9SS type A sorting domain-containing protein [Pontibacter toksunensis]|uniref:T9SS type A sorting domain-containing protein n=1 Tax=Pontibacter toksunensis TaxID=1332631 RepID=A0ABW6BSM2_9BACT